MKSAAGPTRQGALRIGSVSGSPIYVDWTWILVAALIAYLFAPRIDEVAPGLGSLVYVAGLALAVLLYLSVLLHEISHALMAKAFRMRVLSVTLSFLGGVTTLETEPTTPRRQFWIAVVGPLTSAAVGAAALLGALVVPDGLTDFMLQSLALANLALAALNLLPGLPLDGGKVLRSIVWAATGRATTATVVAAWTGRVIAVLAFSYPVVLTVVLDTEPTIATVLIWVLVGWFLWEGASQSLSSAKARSRIPALHAGALARRAVAVESGLPVAEAVRRASESDADSIVVVGPDGRPQGIVVQQALAAMPDDRRAWVGAAAVARSVQQGEVIPADLAGEQLVRTLRAAPAQEYIVVDRDGAPVGVLHASDVYEAVIGR